MTWKEFAQDAALLLIGLTQIGLCIAYIVYQVRKTIRFLQGGTQ